MSEKELTRESKRIIRGSTVLDQALEHLRILLSAEVGDVTLFIVWAGSQPSVFSDAKVLSFLESRVFPSRGVYTAPVGTAATLVACLGSWGSPVHYVQSLIASIGTQLSIFGPKANIAESEAA